MHSVDKKDKGVSKDGSGRVSAQGHMGFGSDIVQLYGCTNSYTVDIVHVSTQLC